MGTKLEIKKLETMRDPNQELNLPQADPAKRMAALERVAGQLMAMTGVLPEEVRAKADVLGALRQRSVQTLTKWGPVESVSVAAILEKEEWNFDGTMQWFQSYYNRQKDRKRRTAQKRGNYIADYLANITDKEIGGVEQLIGLLEDASKKHVPVEVIHPQDNVTVNLKSATRSLREADPQTIKCVIDSANQKIRHQQWENQMGRELQEHLEAAAKPYGVEVYVAELALFGKNSFGVKLYVGYLGDLFEFTGSFNELKAEVGSMVRETAENLAKDVTVCPFCGATERRDVIMKRHDVQHGGTACSCGAKVILEMDHDVNGGSSALKWLWNSGCKAIGLPVPKQWRRLHVDDFFANVKYVGKSLSDYRMWFLKMPWLIKPGINITKEPLPSSPQAMSKIGGILTDQADFKYIEWEEEVTPEYRYALGNNITRWGVGKEIPHGHILVTFDGYSSSFEVGVNIGLFELPEYQQAMKDDEQLVEDPYESLLDNLNGYMSELLGFDIGLYPDTDKETEFATSIKLNDENYDETARKLIAATNAVEKNTNTIRERTRELLKTLYEKVAKPIGAEP